MSLNYPGLKSVPFLRRKDFLYPSLYCLKYCNSADQEQYHCPHIDNCLCLKYTSSNRHSIQCCMSQRYCPFRYNRFLNFSEQQLHLSMILSQTPVQKRIIFLLRMRFSPVSHLSYSYYLFKGETNAEIKFQQIKLVIFFHLRTAALRTDSVLSIVNAQNSIRFFFKFKAMFCVL